MKRDRDDQPLEPATSPLAHAGLLVAARALLRHYNLPFPSVPDILAATGATRSRAYQLAAEVRALMPSLVHKVGRPARTPAAPAPQQLTAVQTAVISFLYANPGCITGHRRKRYSDSFRHFILDLHTTHAGMELTAFAEAVQIPVKTLQDWIQAAKKPPAMDTAAPATGERDCTDTNQSTRGDRGTSGKVDHARIQTILNEYRYWKGPFTAFCAHIRNACQIPYGRTMITTILATHGLRRPAARPGRSPDETALRHAFETFFPGAQWTGDGHEMAIELCGVTYRFNLQLCVDTDSAALVGVHLGPEEDTAAVLGAFTDGFVTTADAPLALLLDNRSCNHTAQVAAALAPTQLIRATLGRPQNKAHVEGAFGLFEQKAPDLRLCATTMPDLAAQFLRLLVQIWGRTLNHRPRRDCGRSRVELYRQSCPTPEQIEHARTVLTRRRIHQEKAYQTHLTRHNPVVRELLLHTFTELGLADPDGQLLLAIARYPLDSIVEAIALFKAKLSAKTLPERAGARYLLGIVKNLAAQREHLFLAEELLRLRLHVRDLILHPLRLELDALLSAHSSPFPLIDIFADRALDSLPSSLNHLFWLHSLAGLIRRQPEPTHRDLLSLACARFRSSFRVSPAFRQQAIVSLTRAVFPLL